jgi:antitoxin component YwqK of YwqJK toxin-antitoxin module
MILERIDKEYYSENQLKSITYERNGVFHRDERDENGNLKQAYISFYENGRIDTIKYAIHGNFTRENDKPTMITYYEDGTLSSETWAINECDNIQLFEDKHRENGPAEISYHTNGLKAFEVYHFNNLEHREDGPSYIEYDEEGNIIKESYSYHGKRIRKSINLETYEEMINELPNEIEYFENGTIKLEKWVKDKPEEENIDIFDINDMNEYFHRDKDGLVLPSVIKYYPNGNIKNKIYYYHNKLHNTNGPAFEVYFNNGNIKEKTYCNNGIIHRLDGPANIIYNNQGQIIEENYIINGNILSLDKFLRYVYFFIRKIYKYKNKQRSRYIQKLSRTNINNSNGKDILKLISKFTF